MKRITLTVVSMLLLIALALNITACVSEQENTDNQSKSENLYEAESEAPEDSSLILSENEDASESSSETESSEGESEEESVSSEPELSEETDTVPPELKGEDFEILFGETFDYKSFVTVTDDYDAAPEISVDNSKVNLKKPGTYNVVYTATDKAGNSSSLTIKLTVKVLPGTDYIPPKITGKNFSIEFGDSVSYRNQVTVTDDYDEAPTLKIDNSKVDLDSPGTYTVIYTATDKSGNSSQLKLKLTVKEPISLEKMEEYVTVQAQKILASITKDSMTPLEKAYKIYRWTKYNHIAYSKTSDKSHWIVGAYNGFKNRRGDCFTYFAVSKALLIAAGIETFDMEKHRTDEKATRHYWALVNVGDGWYHMDCTPFAAKRKNVNFFMVTNEEIWAWDDKYYKGEHTYLPEGVPEVATESIQDRVNYNWASLKY